MKWLVSIKLEIGNIFNKAMFLKFLFITNDMLTRLKYQCFSIFIAVSREKKIKSFLFRHKCHAFNLWCTTLIILDWRQLKIALFNWKFLTFSPTPHSQFASSDAPKIHFLEKGFQTLGGHFKWERCLLRSSKPVSLGSLLLGDDTRNSIFCPCSGAGKASNGTEGLCISGERGVRMNQGRGLKCSCVPLCSWSPVGIPKRMHMIGAVLPSPPV